MIRLEDGKLITSYTSDFVPAFGDDIKIDGKLYSVNGRIIELPHNNFVDIVVEELK